MLNRTRSFDGKHMATAALPQRAPLKPRYTLYFILFYSHQHASHMTCCDVLIWCFPARLTSTGRRWDRPHWLWLHSPIAYISRRLTGSGGGCNLKTKPILCTPCQGWETSADTTTKMCPSFSPEKGSFHFINSRLKRNYLPIDPNRHHKGNRTKKQLLLSVLKFFFYFLCCFFFILYTLDESIKWSKRIALGKWRLIFKNVSDKGVEKLQLRPFTLESSC